VAASSRIELTCPCCKGQFIETLSSLARYPTLACPMCGRFLDKAATATAVRNAQERLCLARLLSEMTAFDRGLLRG